MGAPPESMAGTPTTRAERAAEITRVLAREPRPAGSDAEAQARAYCSARLRAAGFQVQEEPFEYSAFVGRWGTPIGGVVALAVLLTAGRAGQEGWPLAALSVLALGAALLAVAGRWMARRGVLDFPALRRRGVNLVATRSSGVDTESGAARGSPPIWLMAHVDSKSQPVPILARAAGITVVVFVWIVAVAIAGLQLLGAMVVPALWLVVGGVAIVGALPVIATTVGVRSPGALDNATGVATVLAAVEDVKGAPVGVCLTSAEELGLPGARAWVRHRGRQPSVVVNCDTIDDNGTTTCMYSGARPDALVATVLAAGSRTGSMIRAHRLLPGVLTDGVAVADAGWPVVTLSKGGVRTLARVHTARDRADMITGAGMAEVARVLVELIETRT